MAIDLRQLRNLTAIIDHGGFARAAEARHLSQPAVSASIRELEASLGVSLLERGPFGARPTPAGRRLYDRARLILAEVRRADDEMAALRDGEGGNVTVGIGPLFEQSIMPAVLADFLDRWPRVGVTTVVDVTEGLLGQLASGELDFTVSSPTGWQLFPDDIDVEVLQDTHDVIIASADHPIWAAGDFSLAALARQPWIVSARVGEATRTFFQAFASAGVAPPRTLVRTDSMPILRQLVAERGFLCVVSPHLTAPVFTEMVGMRAVRVVPGDWFGFPRRICLARRRGSLLTMAAAELVDTVRLACRELQL